MKKQWKSIAYFMKVTTLVYISIITTAAVTKANSGHSQVLEQRVSVVFDGTPLVEALQLLEQQTGLDFVYSQNFIPGQEKVTGKYRNEPLKTVLKELFVPFDIAGQLVNNQIVLQRQEPETEVTLQVQGYGSVVGQVLEKGSNSPLPGALVVIKGSTNGGVTDLKGYFRIDNLPAGKATLQCSYIGYQSVELETIIQPRVATTLDFELQLDIVGLQEVVVSGNLEGQSKALNQQRAADNIKNIISADLISRFPDLNVSEALQRVPGINISRDNGEGAAVQVRGTPANYTSIQVNGEQLPGNGLEGDRSPSLTLYPVDQLASIEVTKSITPDMDGDAIGGVVNLLPPIATNLETKIKAELGGGYNNLSKGVNGIGRFSYGRRFAPSAELKEGRFGIFTSGSYFRTDNGEDRTESQWATRDFGEGVDEWYLRRHDLRALQTQRTRAGAGINLDYKFSKLNKIQFNFMYSYLEEDEIRTRTRFRIDDGNRESPELSTGATVRKTFRDRIVGRDNFNYTLFGTFDLKGFQIEPGIFYTTSKRDESAKRADFQREGVDLAIDNADTEFPQVTSANPEVDLNDATLFTDWRNYRPYERVNETENLVAKLNITKPVRFGKISGFVKGGYKYRTTNSTRNAEWFVYEFEEGRQDLFPRFADYDVVSQDFLTGAVDFGPGFNTDAVKRFFDQNTNQFTRNTDDEIFENANFFYDATETTNAAYLMSKLNLSPDLLILFGARYENIDVDYDALRFIDSNVPGVPNTSEPVDGSRSYDFILPNFQIKYTFNRMTNIRAAVVRSFARANFIDIVPSSSVNVNSSEITRGNPSLLPPVAWNFDLKLERYLGNVGILSVSGFFKEVDNFQFERVFIADSLVNTDIPAIYNGFQVEEPANGEEAKVWGIETNIQTNLNFLPGPLKGLGIYLNYTYTGSNAFTADRSDIRLPGQADHTGNFAITYDLGGFTARASLNYQDDLIESLGPNDDGDGEKDVVRDSRYQLDINASQKIGDQFRVYAEFINITNQPQLQYFGQPDRIFDVGYFSWWCRFGVSFTL
ncbi:MAG: TonB-dependent receptor [Cyclobacteriaceae bacterium]|nr:TonB-dependent receptor [Cyclobacteriaceae bacterium HetDA_MAG_MS6]